MSVQDFVELIVGVVKTHQEWAVPIAFLVAFAESFCFFSIIWPGTAILAGITALLAASGADQTILLPSIVAAGLGGTLGYAISYWIGLYFKDSIPHIWPFKNQPELIRHGENFFDKWGGWGVFFGHFFGPVRAIIPVVAGMFRMRQLPFQIANAVSAFIWAAGVIAPSFFAVTFREEIVAYVREHHLIVAGLLFLTAFLNSIPMPLIAIPTLLLFIASAAIFFYANGDPMLAFSAGFAGAVIGDLMAYRFGRSHQGEDLHNVWSNSWSPEIVRSGHRLCRKTWSRWDPPLEIPHHPALLRAVGRRCHGSVFGTVFNREHRLLRHLDRGSLGPCPTDQGSDRWLRLASGGILA